MLTHDPDRDTSAESEYECLSCGTTVTGTVSTDCPDCGETLRNTTYPIE